MSNPVKVVIAHNDVYFRTGFKTVLEMQKEILVLAEAADGNELLQQVDTWKPDVVITDLVMPGTDVLQVCKSIRKRFPSVGIMALCAPNTQNLIHEALQSGISTCLSKNTRIQEVIKAAGIVKEGGTYVSDELTGYFTSMLQNRLQKQRKLSGRELEVIHFICQQYTSREIADALFISERTVEDHRKNIQQKLKVRNVAGIVVYAIKHYLVQL